MILLCMMFLSGCSAEISNGDPLSTGKSSDTQPDELTHTLSEPREMPKPTKYYLSGDERYCESSSYAWGSITYELLEQMVDLTLGSEGRNLRNMLDSYGLFYEIDGEIKLDSIDEVEVKLTKYMDGRILAVDIVCSGTGDNTSVSTITHLLFERKEDRCVFRGVINEIVDCDPRWEDQIMTVGDDIYFCCRHGNTLQSGQIENVDLCCITATEPVMQYNKYTYKNIQSTASYVKMYTVDQSSMQLLQDGRISMKMEIRFSYSTYVYRGEDIPAMQEFKDATTVNASMELFNDRDGKGFYSYDPQVWRYLKEPDAVPEVRAQCRKGLQRAAASENECVRELTQDILENEGYMTEEGSEIPLKDVPKLSVKPDAYYASVNHAMRFDSMDVGGSGLLGMVNVSAYYDAATCTATWLIDAFSYELDIPQIRLRSDRYNDHNRTSIPAQVKILAMDITGNGKDEILFFIDAHEDTGFAEGKLYIFAMDNGYFHEILNQNCIDASVIWSEERPKIRIKELIGSSLIEKDLVWNGTEWDAVNT